MLPPTHIVCMGMQISFASKELECVACKANGDPRSHEMSKGPRCNYIAHKYNAGNRYASKPSAVVFLIHFVCQAFHLCEGTRSIVKTGQTVEVLRFNCSPTQCRCQPRSHAWYFGRSQTLQIIWLFHAYGVDWSVAHSKTFQSRLFVGFSHCKAVVVLFQLSPETENRSYCLTVGGLITAIVLLAGGVLLILVGESRY